jgi:hypothetical protein
MRLVADSGLWSTGPRVAPTPLAAVLEVSGAVLSWTIDDPRGSVGTRITFTDPTRADWLWRVLGESGHVAVAAALQGREANEPRTIDVAGVSTPFMAVSYGTLRVDTGTGSVDRLRRLAIGHWLRRWWPASHRDGIAGLDRALLDAEIAVLTAEAEEFFSDDTLDSDVEELLAPHASALTAHVRAGDPRVLQLAGAAAELVETMGADGSGWAELSATLAGSAAPGSAVVDLAAAFGVSADHGPAAGPAPRRPGAVAIARGVGSIRWGAVPPGVFDAAEETITWRIEVADSVSVAVVHAVVTGPASAGGVAVRLRSKTVSGTGVLDAEGRATLQLVNADRQPVTESAARDHDWADTQVTIGADVDESPETRQRIRQFARARLDRLASDAFLAEILAAERPQAQRS